MKTYGLIGKTLGHSFSKKYFSDFFAKNGLLDRFYKNFEIQDLQKEIPSLKEMSGLSGLNVTIPYKTAIIPFLDDLTDDCREINACNCIAIKDGKWTGHNTDIVGFEKSFSPALRPEHKKALILGDGGAASAVKFVLEKLQIPYLTVSRKNYAGAGFLNYEEVTPELIQHYNIIINTTPLGMYPDVNEAPELPYAHIDQSNYLYDLVYNPSKTLFLLKGEEKGATIENGANMLVLQAEESWRIWEKKVRS